MSKYLPHCAECGTSKAILSPISATLDREYLCQDCYGVMDPWPNWIRREATDFEIIGSTPIGFTKKILKISLQNHSNTSKTQL